MDVSDDQGNYISYNNIDSGTSDLLWIINFDEDNTPDGLEFELDWYYIIDWEWSNQISGKHTWTNDNTSYLEVPWNITVTDFDCDVYAQANPKSEHFQWLAECGGLRLQSVPSLPIHARRMVRVPNGPQRNLGQLHRGVEQHGDRGRFLRRPVRNNRARGRSDLRDGLCSLCLR